TAYDGFGRAVAAYDGNGDRTTTTYTMTGAGLTSGVTVANPLSQTTSSTLDPQRGLTLTSTDANGVVTTNRYDALGRITAVWLDSRAATLPANYTYSYQVANTGVTAVTTRKLNDESAYQTSVLLYDALLRERQRQVDTPRSGRMVSDTFYDSRGWVRAKYNGWWDATTTPDTTVVGATGVIPSQDFYTYDGLGRTVVDASADSGVTISTTTTVYNSDRTTVVPPTGGVVQTTVTDPLGRTAELDQYTTQPAVNRPADPFTGLWTVSGGTTT